MSVVKFAVQVGYLLAAFVMLFGPGFVGAFVLIYFGAAEWMIDIFVSVYILGVIILLLTYAMYPGTRGHVGGWIG